MSETRRDNLAAAGAAEAAAGGIRSYEDLKAMLSAGATRIGASASVRILQEAAGAPVEPAAAAARY